MSLLNAAPWAIIAIGAVGLVWIIRKAGKDAAENDAEKNALKDINNALRPITDDELDSVQRKYKRD